MRFLLRLALAVLIGSTTRTTTTVLAQQQTTIWGRLGPAEPDAIRAIAPGPGWPQNGLLLAARDARVEPGHEVVRTRDGGATWESVHAPMGRIGGLVLAPSGGPTPIAFAITSSGLFRSADAADSWQQVLRQPGEPISIGHEGAFAISLTFDRDGVAFYGFDRVLYRSTDRGLTWSQALVIAEEVPGACSNGRPRCNPACPEYTGRLADPNCPQLILSPDLADDGVVLYRSYAQLYRSRDSGASWRRVTASGDQLVQQVLASPDFGRDKTLVMAATSSHLPESSSFDPSDTGSAADHERSVGVLISTDAGETWTASSAGLEVNGTPYRQVQRLAISPTFTQDGTLFAFSWGPREQSDAPPRDPREAPVGADGIARTWRGALFRSTDRGSSWVPVDEFGPSWSRPHPLIELSSHFAADGVALLALTTPAGEYYQCRVRRSTNGGATWQDSLRPRSAACTGVLLTYSSGQLQGLVNLNGAWLQSPDGGVSWDNFMTPAGIPVTVVQPSQGQDVVFVGGRAGSIWLFGQQARLTDGQLACPVQPKGGFGRLWQAELWTQERLGCAIELEHPVRVRQQELSRSRGIWIDDGRPDWFDLSGDGQERASYYIQREEAKFGWPAGTEQVVDGVAQRFAGGMLLSLPYPDGRRVILAITRTGDGEQWHQYVDADSPPVSPVAPPLSVSPGTITTMAGYRAAVARWYGGDNGPAAQALLHVPQAIVVGPDGSLYIADSQNDRIRRVDPSGTIVTIAGDGTHGYGGDDGPARQAQFRWPSGVALGPDGSLYIADTFNARVRRVDPDGTISTIAGGGGEPQVDDDGSAASIRLDLPWDVAVDAQGSLFIVDRGSSTIIQLRPDGSVVTLGAAAASCDPQFWQPCFSGDGGPAVDAQFRPASLSAASDQSLYIADSSNNRVRRVGPDGTITTVAGDGTRGGGGDGGPATSAQLDHPSSVVVARDGRVYIADSGNRRVRRVALDGTISTVAGDGRDGAVEPPGDGGFATAAPLRNPQHLALDGDGNVYISEPEANVVRKVWHLTST